MKHTDLRIHKILKEIESKSQFSKQKKFMQHGTTSVYQHSVAVAILSYHFAKKYNVKVDYDSLIRGALLHDYFLYDWHEKNKEHSLHGFRHPKTALRNAEKEFNLTNIERNIIDRHMFPMTIIPPSTSEAWIVCLSDKICAFKETFEPYEKTLTKFSIKKLILRIANSL